jgi:phage terminase small subunit
MRIMANTNLTNQRQIFVEEYVRSGDHLEAAKKAGYKDTHTLLEVTSTSFLKDDVYLLIEGICK